MRGLTREERRALLPGPPGDCCSGAVLLALLQAGRMREVPDPDGPPGSTVLETTEAGRLALQVCPT
jgi:hypothetical protein